MSNKEEKEKEKEIDWSKIEPCTIEDIIISNIATKRLVLKFNNGKEDKQVFVEFRKLDMEEGTILGNIDYQNDNNRIYQRKILHMASLVPKFPKDTDLEAWNKIKLDNGFINNYVRKINEYANEDNFL